MLSINDLCIFLSTTKRSASASLLVLDKRFDQHELITPAADGLERSANTRTPTSPLPLDRSRRDDDAAAPGFVFSSSVGHF